MKKNERQNNFVTFLTDEQIAQLTRVSAMTGTPASILIRMAVAEYLKKLPKSLTMVSKAVGERS